MPDEIDATEIAAGVEADMSGNALTIRVTPRGDGVPLGTFLGTMRDSLRILRDLDQSFSNGVKTLDWRIVSASYNSPLTLRIIGRPLNGVPTPQRIADAYLDGLAELEGGGEPPTFSERALLQAKEIALLVLRDGLASVEFSCPGKPTVTPTRKLAANVEGIMRRRYYHEDSSLEGMLEALDIHGKFYFVLYDVLTGLPTKCHFEQEFLGRAISSLGRRVSVEGRVKFNRAGMPVAMEVHDMVELRSVEDLPQFAEGEQINITGGIESAEYVRRLRDAE